MSLSIPVTLMTALLPLWMSSLATVGDAGAATTRPPSVAPRACQPGALDKAQALYDAGRFDQAYAGFAVLADCGNADAARWALQMRQGGPARYGQAFMAGPTQLQRWRQIAAAAPRTGTPPPPPTH